MATSASPSYGGSFPGRSGWLGFAGMLGIVLGIFNVIEGFIALFKETYYVTPGGRLLVFDYTTWGWIWLIIGVIQVGVGIGILAGKMWARWTGVGLAALAMLGQFAFMAAYPIWALLCIALSVLIMYGLISAPKGATG